MITSAARNANQPQQPASDSPQRKLPIPDPPRPHRWLLVISAMLMLGWILFLAYLAWVPF